MKYKADRKIRCYDDYSAYEDSDFIIDDSFEYDEEYEAYENECVEELTETYKEYAGDILDEYSEYDEDWDEEAIMTKIDNVFYGSKEDWLNSKEYVITDILDDQFAVNFDQISIKERIARGEEVLEPEVFDETGSFAPF